MNAAGAKRSLHPIVALILLCFAFVAPLFAQPDAAPPRLLRIGWLASQEESGPTADSMQALRESLLADEAVARLLRDGNYGGIGLYETDGERDMLLRLGARELDIAFLPARLWAEQTAGYAAVLQTRRPTDATATRGNMVFRRGVVVAGASSPLFEEANAPYAATLAEELRAKPVAAVSTQSMAGHIAPMLALADAAGAENVAPQFLWFESSADVARAVACGLAEIGICEEGECERALAEGGFGKDAPAPCRVVLRSVPVPSDPVAFHPDLAPRSSELGRELKRALRAFSMEKGFGDTALQSAQDEDYAETRALLARWKALDGEDAP